MSTPQNPEDGDTPQDPSDPQNPYGTPPSSPPPPPPPPYAPPSTPPREPASPPAPPPPPPPPPPRPPSPPPPPPPGEPASPPAPPPPATPPPATPLSTPPPSAPPVTPPAAPPTTAIPPATVPPATPPAAPGTTPPPYGQPTYGQQPYPQTGPMPGQDTGAAEASKGTAIAALIVAFFGCTCIGAIVSIILSIVVLRRGKDGRNHGKGLAITAIIISVISLVIGLLIAAGVGYLSTLTGVDDLKTGQCLTADGLTDQSSDGVSNINIVSCSKAHDAEVLAPGRLTKDEVGNFNAPVCVAPIQAAGKADLIVPPLTYNGLSGSD